MGSVCKSEEEEEEKVHCSRGGGRRQEREKKVARERINPENIFFVSLRRPEGELKAYGAQKGLFRGF